MSLELVKESIRINNMIGEETAQTIVEHDIIVPDTNPDAVRILLMDGEVFERSSEVLQDRVAVNGTIRYKILYISDEENNAIRSITANNDFLYNLDVLNAKYGMKANVNCDIEHVDYEILYGRKVKVKAIVKIDAKVTEEVEQDFVNNLEGLEDIEILKNNADVNSYMGENNAHCNINESMEIPAGKPTIKEILRSDVKIVGKDYKLSDNKVIAKGDLNILTLYIADDEERSIQFMEHEVPFTQFIDIQGIDEGCECEVDYRVLNYTFKPGEDNDGELRVLSGDIELLIKAQAYEKRQVDVIADAYSLSRKLSIEQKSFSSKRVICREKNQINLKETVVIDGDNPEIAEVFNVLSKPSMFECNAANGSINIEGAVNNSILYVAKNSEQPVFCYDYEIPFKQNIEVSELDPNMDCEVDLDVEHCNYSMISANDVEIRVIINVYVEVIDNVEIPLVSKVTDNAIEDKKGDCPSITIYFSQPDDTMWKIAKKYYTTVEDIKKVNNLSEDDNITPGQQVMIPRKSSAS
ncbi:MAG: LysM domain protein [Firmicutes bacterium ADurb.Bin419]|nr:MAG: LysM domain protein [Firmicutes bacterium ADurb.Bin419]